MAFSNLRELFLHLQTTLRPVVLSDGVPRRVHENFYRYDVIRGFEEYHRFCQQNFEGSIPSVDTPLLKEHVEILRFFSEEKALEIRQQAEKKARTVIYKRGTDNRGMLEIPDRDFYYQILKDVFSPGVEARIIRYFGSHFVPYWFTFQITRPKTEESRAFCWHCDKGPSKWLKILLYFTDTEETGGATVILDKKESDIVARTDYTFNSVKNRTGRIEELERRAGCRLNPIQPRLRPGEGILFEPARLLHKGQLPDRADRFIMQILILPSPRPWEEALERLEQADLPERADFAFPDHARKLQQILA